MAQGANDPRLTTCTQCPRNVGSGLPTFIHIPFVGFRKVKSEVSIVYPTGQHAHGSAGMTSLVTRFTQPMLAVYPYPGGQHVRGVKGLEPAAGIMLFFV